MSFLDRVVAERRADAAGSRARGVEVEREAGPPRSLRLALRGFAPAMPRDEALQRGAPVGREVTPRQHAIAVIAEVKRISPALGPLAPAIDPAMQAALYAAAGAAAISVLVEPRHWGGSLDDLRRVREAVRVPVLAKDVVVDPIQIDEAYANGADAVLLIAEALDDAALVSLLAHARTLGLDAIVEAHDTAAFGRAVRSGATIVGANARDLRDPSIIDRGRARLLHSFVRPGQIFVAESGIESADDVLALPARVDAILVGTALMRSSDPGAVVRALASARRRVARVR